MVAIIDLSCQLICMDQRIIFILKIVILLLSTFNDFQEAKKKGIYMRSLYKYSGIPKGNFVHVDDLADASLFILNLID